MHSKLHMLVSVGGISVTNQYLAGVTKESSEFTSDPIDGLMGMGLPALSQLKHVRPVKRLLNIVSQAPQDPFFSTAVMQGAVSDGTFAFKLASSGSELFLGGTNTDLYTGSIEYHSLSSTVGYWIIGNGSVSVNGQTTASDIQTVIDTGSTLVTAPTSAADEFWQAVKGAKSFDQADGFYSFPCDSVPEAAFSWGGKTWTISADK